MAYLRLQMKETLEYIGMFTPLKVSYSPQARPQDTQCWTETIYCLWYFILLLL